MAFRNRTVDARAIYRTPEAADYTGMSASYLNKKRLTGGGPDFIRLGGKAIGYRREDLDRWMEENKFSSTSEYPVQGAGKASRP